jgi:hypothetical protein
VNRAPAGRHLVAFGSVYTCDFEVRIAVLFGVQFPAQGGLQLIFKPISPDMWLQAVVIGVQRIIKTPNPLYAMGLIHLPNLLVKVLIDN